MLGAKLDNLGVIWDPRGEKKTNFWGLSSDHHTYTATHTNTNTKFKLYIENLTNSSSASSWVLFLHSSPPPPHRPFSDIKDPPSHSWGPLKDKWTLWAAGSPCKLCHLRTNTLTGKGWPKSKAAGSPSNCRFTSLLVSTLSPEGLNRTWVLHGQAVPLGLHRY